ncbi:hypothetical protein N7457_002131 [Penicillium paradoxum]|uniref:uncharacterized protein n=1 Tax=Penicillium paradoxum TaxID=176176 RepID=UPI0025486DD4|nr:uncharacterized protein N7457_002131 [Penicillium paradoxum]KAJ5787141.1 hypothetical protein N7457_002131 [Penicillium paradoxum]
MLTRSVLGGGMDIIFQGNIGVVFPLSNALPGNIGVISLIDASLPACTDIDHNDTSRQLTIDYIRYQWQSIDHADEHDSAKQNTLGLHFDALGA